MLSSISNSKDEPLGGAKPAEPPFAPRALVMLAIVFGVPIATGYLAGRSYAPQLLAPTASEVAHTDGFVVLFGNSRFEAGILPGRLAERLGEGRNIGTRAFIGGGWDALHYYQLALLNQDVLRPSRDSVLIEVSPLSLDDAQVNRLGAIRPETAALMVALPDAPLETRLELLLGAASGLFRYRSSLQSVVLGPKLERTANLLTPALSRLGAIGPAPAEKPFELITAPGRDFVIQEIKGDSAAFLEVRRRQLTRRIGELEYGGFKLEALRRAVRVLRARGIQVFLVQVPTSTWLTPRLRQACPRFEADMKVLVSETGARFISTWPDALYSSSQFWDEEHMVAAASESFTDALATELNR